MIQASSTFCLLLYKILGFDHTRIHIQIHASDLTWFLGGPIIHSELCWAWQGGKRPPSREGARDIMICPVDSFVYLYRKFAAAAARLIV